MATDANDRFGRKAQRQSLSSTSMTKIGQPALGAEKAMSPVLDAKIPRPKHIDYTRNLFESTRPGTPAIRPEDMIALRIELVGLEVSRGSPPRLRKSVAGDAYLILHFPPQSIAEETFFEAAPAKIKSPNEVGGGHPHPNTKEKPEPSGGGSEALRAPPVRARIADESRLAFVVPDGFEVDYTLSSVLHACQSLELKVAANAKPRSESSGRFRLEDVFQIKASEAATLKQRASLAKHAATAVRIGAIEGDISTLRARQPAGGQGLVTRPQFDPPIVVVPGPIDVAIRPAPPGSTTTAIEMPWRLVLSPHRDTRWRHSSTTSVSAATGRTELWHSRLVAPDEDGNEIEPPYADPNRTTRAIWALAGEGSEAATPPMQGQWPDSSDLPPPGTSPFRTTLDNFDRYQIAHLSSNFGVASYAPAPIETNLLALSSFGGWLNSRGAWDPPGLSVEEWVHRASMGRDHYVRVVYRGFLFPFGHRVSLVKVSERKFHNGKATAEQRPGNVAYLRQRLFIVVREKDRTFDDAAWLAAERQSGTVRVAREFPFSRVSILTETTPDLDDPNLNPSSILGQLMFWPHVGQKPFRFQCAGTDLDGRRVLFDLPMIFIDSTKAAPRSYSYSSKKLVPHYETAESVAALAQGEYENRPEQYNTAELDLQSLALATSRTSGDTSVQVERIRFGGVAEPNNESLRDYSRKLTRPLWVPRVVETRARIGPIAQLTGKQQASTLVYNNEFLRVGFDPNPSGNVGEVFVDVKPGSGPNLDFSEQGDRSGGFVQPNLKPAALSRLAGPVMSDPAQFIKGKMPAGAGFPTSISDLPLPLLFGCIPLGEIIDAVADLNQNPEKVPRFVSEASSKLESFINTLVRLYSFVIDLSAKPANIAAAAMTAFKATVDDLKAQAAAYALAQVQPVIDSLELLKAKLTEIANIAIQLASLDLEAAITSAELASLPTSISEARARIADVKTAANAAPGGISLPSGFRQAVLNTADKLDILLADLQKMQGLVTAGAGLFTALDDIVGQPEHLPALLTDSVAFQPKLAALAAAIDPLEAAIGDFKLLEGAPKTTILEALSATQEVLGNVVNLLEFIKQLTGDELTVRFDWSPEISSWWLPGASPSDDPIFRVNDKKGFLVAVEAKMKKAGGAGASFGVTCSLKHFDLVLIAPASFMELNFEKIEFSASTASKMDVDVLLSDIKFVGPLSFVETLRDLIPLDGFSDPPYLDITAKGIDAGFDVSLPSIAVGVLNISNLSLGAGFTVPFIGQPLSVRFNFCRREQPFLLTVWMFGGGGFFGVTIDPHGVQILEASFEFGAAVSIDFGVASGGVHVMAGIYYRMEKDAATLTGYFRLGGHVDVLGIITASLELYLELRYETQSGKCVGKAQLTIEISVFIFSGSVTITCERKFAGANGDPTLRQMLGFDPSVSLEDELGQIDETTRYAWREHVEAFA